MSKKESLEEVISSFKKVHGDRYDYSKVDYIGWNKDVEIICSIHGSFFQKPTIHKTGSGCQKCNPKKIIDFNEFILRTRNIHGDRYDYSVADISQTNIKIICQDHGIFTQSKYNHLLGANCPKCSKINKVVPNSEVLNRLNKHRHILDNFDNVNYTRNTNKIIINCIIHGPYEKHLTNYINGFRCQKCTPKSSVEYEILNLIPSSTINNRTFISPLEIDILSEKFKFGIEYNGLIWHSYGKSSYEVLNNLSKLDKNKHSNKTNMVEEKGFHLFQIREDQWLNPIKKEIWKSIILNKINQSKRIFARKTYVVDLSNFPKLIETFLNENHLEGFTDYDICYGLIYKNRIYSIICLSKNDSEWELKRFCNFRGYLVVGGISKLFTTFEIIHKPTSVITYANRNWSSKNIYGILGFNYIEYIEPEPEWFNPKNNNFIRVPNDINIKNNDLYNNGFRVFFGCGKNKFKKVYK